MVVNVHEPKNYEALFTPTHYSRNLECINKGLCCGSGSFDIDDNNSRTKR